MPDIGRIGQKNYSLLTTPANPLDFSCEAIFFNSGPAFFLFPNLRKRGIPTGDLETVYRREYQTNGKILYQLDDSHWNPEGVRIAAELLHKKIAELIK